MRSRATFGNSGLFMWLLICISIPEILGEQNVRYFRGYFKLDPGWAGVRTHRNTAEVSGRHKLSYRT